VTSHRDSAQTPGPNPSFGHGPAVDGGALDAHADQDAQEFVAVADVAVLVGVAWPLRLRECEDKYVFNDRRHELALQLVGFETSPPDRIGEGGAADPSRTWGGFVTDDRRLVGAIAGYLQGVSDWEAPRPWMVMRWRGRRCCWSRPTTGWTGPMPRAAGSGWRWLGAKVLRGPVRPVV
jgi:hypothetical protein